MASFDSSLSKVKQAEGGYSSDIRDSGNFVDGQLVGTNWGISAPVLKQWLGHTPTADEMKNLDWPTAQAIYKKYYWDQIGGDGINNQSIADLLFDGAVNEGVGKMSQIVGDSLGIKAYPPFTTTLQFINNADQQKLFNDIKAKRQAHYTSLGGYALTSWLNRLKQITFTAVQDNPVASIIVLLMMAGALYLMYNVHYNHKL